MSPTPTTRRPRRTRSAIGVLVVIAAALLAACSSGASTTDAAASDTTVVDGGDAFPVSIDHAFGTTTLTEAPERIVVVGLKEQDYYLALGVVPVAIRDWYGEMPSATWPWAQDELGDAQPVVLPRSELNYEQILALDPDVIVGLSSGMTEDEYDLLSQIAPTVAQPEGDANWEVTWQEMTRAAGTITGKRAEAEAMVVALESRIAKVAAEHPELQGASSVFASSYEGQTYLYSPATTASKVLLSLGLTMSPTVTELTDNADQSLVLSPERLDLLDADVAVWSEGTEDDGAQAMLANPLYTTLAVHTAGRDVFLGKEANGAFVFSSVLSLPYVLDEIVPALAAAVDGDRATSSAFTPQ